MSSDEIAIRVSNVSKCYHIYDRPQDRLKQAIIPSLQRIMGRQPKNYFREFWALRDVSLEIKKGEAVGIIGRNGSGKSTLLQLICGTLTPTSGTVETKGRIAALLELGSGFNPEFTGRENVYMNGVLLGLNKDEIDARFDDIAAFADIGDFIDQPMKTYSSGMYVRLAFAVQACIDPDILIVDEALAVGDALFQKRCFQKIEQLTSSGVTLLFVSHDQETVRTLTKRALLLHEGHAQAWGLSSEVILDYRRLLHQEETRYLSQLSEQQKQRHVASSLLAISKPENSGGESSLRSNRLQFGNLEAEVLDVRIYNEIGEENSVFYPGDIQRIRIRIRTNCSMSHLNVGIRIRNKEGVKIYSWGTLNQDMYIREGSSSGPVFWEKSFAQGEITDVWIEHRCPLGANLYEIQASVSEEGQPYYGEQRILHWVDEAAFFTVVHKQREYFFGGVADLQARAEF